MRRVVVFSLVLASALLAVLVGGRPTALHAQEATPAAGPNFTVGQLSPIGERIELLPGVDLEFLNEAPSGIAPGHHVVLYRVIFSGGETPIHVHHGTTVQTVESGALSWTLEQGTVTVTRPGAAPEQVTEPGTELVLQPGEGLAYYDDVVVGKARAAGDEETSVVFAGLFEAGEPVVTLTNEQGTPVASGTPAA